MKKLLCITLVILCSFCLFARDRHVTQTQEGRQVEDLLEDGLYENQDEIITIVPLLTPSEITSLYSKNKISGVLDTLENTLFGFGIGSFTSGDLKGGLIQLGLEGGGIILSAISFGDFLAYGAANILGVLFKNKNEKNEKLMAASAIGLLTGAGAFLIGRIYGIVRGIKYPLQYNKDLQNTLYGYESAYQLSIAPVFSTTGIGFGVGVKF